MHRPHLQGAAVGAAWQRILAGLAHELEPAALEPILLLGALPAARHLAKWMGRGGEAVHEAACLGAPAACRPGHADQPARVAAAAGSSADADFCWHSPGRGPGRKTATPWAWVAASSPVACSPREPGSNRHGRQALWASSACQARGSSCCKCEATTPRRALLPWPTRTACPRRMLSLSAALAGVSRLWWPVRFRVFMSCPPWPAEARDAWTEQLGSRLRLRAAQALPA